MKRGLKLIIIFLACFVILLSGCDTNNKIKGKPLGLPDADMPSPDSYSDPDQNPDEPIAEPGIQTKSETGDESIEVQETLAKEILFEEDFSGDLASWTTSLVPTVKDGALSSKDLSIYTTNNFPSQKGIELSFDFFLASSPTGGFNIKLVEKTYTSNYAALVADTTGNLMYWIEGHCVTPTPKVQVQTSPGDNNFHTFTFRAHTDGSAEWLLDGEVQFQRDDFDLGGDYTLTLSGSSLIGSSEDNVFLDNIRLTSLNEAAPSSDLCPEVPHTPAKNPCEAGRCLSNGICCPSYAPYYCESYCFYSRERAMSKSQGRCSEWQVIC